MKYLFIIVGYEKTWINFTPFNICLVEGVLPTPKQYFLKKTLKNARCQLFIKKTDLDAWSLLKNNNTSTPLSPVDCKNYVADQLTISSQKITIVDRVFMRLASLLVLIFLSFIALLASLYPYKATILSNLERQQVLINEQKKSLLTIINAHTTMHTEANMFLIDAMKNIASLPPLLEKEAVLHSWIYDSETITATYKISKKKYPSFLNVLKDFDKKNTYRLLIQPTLLAHHVVIKLVITKGEFENESLPIS